MTSDLSEQMPRAFAFGRFLLVPARQLLLSDGVPTRVGGRALDILTLLVSRAGELVSKRDLLAQVWPSTVVEEANVKVNMAALRRVLGDDPDEARFIATVAGRGYRFVAPVRICIASDSGLESAAIAQGPRHNLPTVASRLVGRDDVVASILHDVATARLVSIVGAGGVGKSAVAVKVAERAAASLPDGAWFVDLSSVTNSEGLVSAVGSALGLLETARELTTLREFLRSRRLLLVLDTCEHLIEVVADFISQALAHAPGLSVLATTREPLLLKGERVRRLSPLAVPPPLLRLSATDAMAFPAVELFSAFAADAFESFRLGDEEAPLVAEICRRLDGLPLAIELAAARIDTLGLTGLLRRLADRRCPQMWRRAGADRHRSMAAALDWSLCLLSVDEAEFLRAISVFEGAMDIDDAAALSGTSLATAADMLTLLADKSLVVADRRTDNVSYRLFETTRADCLEQLRASGSDVAVRRRHAERTHAAIGHACRARIAKPSESIVPQRRIDRRVSLPWEGDAMGTRSLPADEGSASRVS